MKKSFIKKISQQTIYGELLIKINSCSLNMSKIENLDQKLVLKKLIRKQLILKFIIMIF